MRTTLDISDDVLFAAKELARRDKKTLGQIVSEMMRRGLGGGQRVAEAMSPAGTPAEDDIDIRLRALGFRTLPARGGIVTNELIDRLREQDGV
ncbi:MAG: hypothetical protein Q8L93_11610 [Rhodocyclaceae bacterium]|nr:hypothetical protein [Rhodocyclaceae bacterium]